MFYDLDPGFLGFSIGADFRLPGTGRTMIGSFRWLLSFKHPCPCALGTVTGPRSVWPCAYFLASGKAPPCRCQRNILQRGQTGQKSCSLFKKEKRLWEEFQHAKALSKHGELRFLTATYHLDPHPCPQFFLWENFPTRQAGTAHCEPRGPALRTSLLAPKWGSLIPFPAAGASPG